MRQVWLPVLGFALTGVPLALQAQERQQPPAKESVQAATVRGKIVRMEGKDRYVVRTNENKDVIFYTNPQTRYTIEGKAGKYADLRVGAEVTSAYTTRDDRYYVNTVALGGTTVDPPTAGRTTLRGKIVKLDGDDRVVIRTNDNKNITLMTTPRAKYVINGKAGRFTDLRVGVDVDFGYTLRDERYYIDSATVGAVVTEPLEEGATVQGTIVRIVGEDQVVVKTQGNKEVIIYVQPKTKYLVNDEAGRFTDLRSGADIRIQYDERDQRRLARSIFWKRK